MKAAYKKEYIKEKCIERISMLEVRYSKIDFFDFEEAYSKGMAIDYDEQQVHHDARKSGYSTATYLGASEILNFDMMLLNAKKDSIRNDANIIKSKIKKLKRFVSICEDDGLTEITLDDDEIELIFLGG